MILASKTSGRTNDSRATHVALLRGINVGGKNKLTMADLAEILVQAGAHDVRTYVQSGNAIFRASATVIRHLPIAVSSAIEDRVGFASPIVIRRAKEWQKAADGNPFLIPGVDLKSLHVAFLSEAPDPRAIADLDPNRSPGDAFQAIGCEIYLHLPNGMARTKLTNAWFDSKLGVISTIRNWNTVVRILEMIQE